MSLFLQLLDVKNQGTQMNDDNARTKDRSHLTTGSIVALLAVGLLLMWLFWAKLWNQWVHLLGSGGANEEMVQPDFQMLEVFVASVAATVALLTYLIERDRRRKEREEEKRVASREARMTQAAFLAQTIPFFLDKLKEFGMALDAVTIGDKRGSPAIESFLYKPFRERERAARKSSDEAEMDRIDKEFIARCDKADFEIVAKPLWELLNWIMYQQLFFESFSADGSENERKSVRDAFLEVLRATQVLPTSLQYVFGKYRHLKWNLGPTPEDDGRILDAEHGYRGTDYADVVFLYRPTLERLPDSEQKKSKLLKLADERDAKEFGTFQESPSPPKGRLAAIRARLWR